MVGRTRIFRARYFHVLSSRRNLKTKVLEKQENQPTEIAWIELVSRIRYSCDYPHGINMFL